MTSTPTPAQTARVYAGHRSPMGVHHWQELGWDLDRATELATYGHQAREVVVLDGHTVTPLRHYPYHSPTGFEWGYNRIRAVRPRAVHPARPLRRHPDPPRRALPGGRRRAARELPGVQVRRHRPPPQQPRVVDHQQRDRGLGRRRAGPGPRGLTSRTRWWVLHPVADRSDGLQAEFRPSRPGAGTTESTWNWPVAALPLTPPARPATAALKFARANH
jgi:hypothetical protein